MNPDTLFPVRRTRRDFLAAGLAGAAALAVGPALRAADPVRLGEGKATFTLDDDWGKLPAGMNYGLGCAVVVDGKDRVFVTSRSEQPVRRHLRQGRQAARNVEQGVRREASASRPGASAGHRPRPVLEQGGRPGVPVLDGERRRRQGRPKIGARVYKTDLTGKVLYTIGNVDKETDDRRSSTSPTRPTWPWPPTATSTSWTATAARSCTASTRTSSSSRPSAAPARSTASSTPATASGSARSRRSRKSTIADRANNRVEVFSLELEYKRTHRRTSRNPCCFYQHDGQLYVPELAARVTIIDADDKVVARLGDGKKLPKAEEPMKHPEQVRPAARPDASTRRATCTSSSGWATAGRGSSPRSRHEVC